MKNDYRVRCLVFVEAERTKKEDVKVSDIKFLAESLTSRVTDDVALTDKEEESLCKDIAALLAKHFVK